MAQIIQPPFNPASANFNTVRYGTGSPSNALGRDGDFYIDTANNRLYGPRSGGAWPTGFVTLVGPQGIQGTAGTNGTNGINGTNGTNGTNGNTILNGSGAPNNSIGNNNDYYYDTTNLRFYGPKSGGSWSGFIALGTAVGVLQNGVGIPSNSLGSNGDFYFDGQNNLFYGPKAIGVWPTSPIGLNVLQKRSLFRDPGFKVSTENGSSLITLGGSFLYATDAWASVRSTSTGAMTAQRINQLTPGKSAWRLRFKCTTANPSPAANDYAYTCTQVLGADAAYLAFGSANAANIVIRVGVNSSVAGTIPVVARNGAISRIYVGAITIAAGEVNTDVVKYVFLTGDTTVSATNWTIDNTLGLEVCIVFCAGSTYQGTANTWGSSNIYAFSGYTNFMAQTGTFDLFDVDLVDGTTPRPFILPKDYDEEVTRCEYIYKQHQFGFRDYAGSNAFFGYQATFKSMRISPTVSSLGGSSAGGSYSSRTLSPGGNNSAFFQMVTSSSGDAYIYNDNWALNARFR